MLDSSFATPFSHLSLIQMTRHIPVMHVNPRSCRRFEMVDAMFRLRVWLLVKSQPRRNTADDFELEDLRQGVSFSASRAPALQQAKGSEARCSEALP
jgi:hypothetical protein